MPHIEKTTRVAVPVAVAYDRFSQFESFPLFMEGVKEVRRLDARTLRWRAELGGKEVEWDATITEDEPHACIAWRSSGGTRHAGRVVFEPLGSSETRVTLQLDYEPESLTAKVGGALGLLAARVERDLRRFKSLVERPPQPADMRDIPPE